jgi:hypothetical protein
MNSKSDRILLSRTSLHIERKLARLDSLDFARRDGQIFPTTMIERWNRGVMIERRTIPLSISTSAQWVQPLMKSQEPSFLCRTSVTSILAEDHYFKTYLSGKYRAQWVRFDEVSGSPDGIKGRDSDFQGGNSGSGSLVWCSCYCR